MLFKSYDHRNVSAETWELIKACACCMKTNSPVSRHVRNHWSLNQARGTLCYMPLQTGNQTPNYSSTRSGYFIPPSPPFLPFIFAIGELPLSLSTLSWKNHPNPPPRVRDYLCKCSRGSSCCFPLFLLLLITCGLSKHVRVMCSYCKGSAWYKNALILNLYWSLNWTNIQYFPKGLLCSVVKHFKVHGSSLHALSLCQFLLV